MAESSKCSMDGSGSGGVSSPISRLKALKSPWVQVVRGEAESFSTATQQAPEQGVINDLAPALTGQTQAAVAANEVRSLDGGNVGELLMKDVWNKPLNVADNTNQCPGQTLAAADETKEVETSDGGNVGVGSKKAVWNKPLNLAADISPVMGAAESWPDLSVAARLPKSSSSESSSKPVSDVSITPPEGPVISHTPNKYAKPNANSNNNHGNIHRHNSTKRSSSSTSRGGSTGFTRPPPPPTPPPLPPPFPMYEVPYMNSLSPVLDAPIRGEAPHHRPNSNWTARPMGDHSWGRGTFVGGRPRGVVPYANGYGGKHGQERDWHGPRGSNARDTHMPHQMVPPPPHAPRGLIRPLHPGAHPFFAPQPFRPFMNHPMGYDMPSPYPYGHPLPPEAFRGAPIMAPTATTFFHLQTSILKQIEYYFSEANLEKDTYLRSNMDNEAWVPIHLIANFRRVQNLTTNIQLILDTLRNSTAVEVQGNKLRPREWEKWATKSRESFSLSLKNLAIDEASSSGQAPSPSSSLSLKNLAIDEASSSGQASSLSSGQAPSMSSSLPLQNLAIDEASSSGQAPSLSSGQAPSSELELLANGELPSSELEFLANGEL